LEALAAPVADSRLKAKLTRLLRSVAAKPGWVAFSGGVDSTLLLRVALEVNPRETVAIFADSPLQAMVDRENVKRLAAGLGAPLHILPLQPLNWPEFVANSAQRCYHCKKTVYREFARLLPPGLVLLDGTNRDDARAIRPGRQALSELAVETPLLAAGLGKEEIRTLAFRLGLPNWDRPSASCLATRIPTGITITADRLSLVEACEAAIRTLGFGHIRVRPVSGGQRHLQVELAGEEMTGRGFSWARQRIAAALREIGAGRLDFVGRDGVFVNKIE
jgi:uncharacterized protein